MDDKTTLVVLDTAKNVGKQRLAGNNLRNMQYWCIKNVVNRLRIRSNQPCHVSTNKQLPGHAKQMPTLVVGASTAWMTTMIWKFKRQTVISNLSTDDPGVCPW